MYKKRIYKAALLCLILSLAVMPLASCADGIANASRSVNNYIIVCEYDDNLKTVKGSYELSYINNTDVPLNELKLHLYGNAYRENAKYSPISSDPKKRAVAYPDGESYGSIAITNVMLNGRAAVSGLGGEDMDILTVVFDKALYPTARYKINLDFTLKLANVMHRLGYNAKSVNLGNWYPIACVYEAGGFVADPYYSKGDCFYSETANYEVTITSASDMKVAATGELLKSTIDGGKRTDKYRAKAVRDFAIVLGSIYETVSAKAGKTQISYYYYDDASPDVSLKAAVDAVNTFNDLFGDYPYKTLAVVKTGFLHGGMEYPNLVYISDAIEEYDYYREVIVHEVAHQWWYGVIGNDEVRYAWMDEGLADYSTTLFYEKNESYRQDRAERIMQTMRDYLLYADIIKIYLPDGKTLDTSMDRALNEFATEGEYVCMTYVKGQLLFDNLRSTIGDKHFFAGLKKYYAQNMFANVKQPHMVGAFEAASGRDLDGWFNAWVKGTVLITDFY